MSHERKCEVSVRLFHKCGSTQEICSGLLRFPEHCIPSSEDHRQSSAIAEIFNLSFCPRISRHLQPSFEQLLSSSWHPSHQILMQCDLRHKRRPFKSLSSDRIAPSVFWNTSSLTTSSRRLHATLSGYCDGEQSLENGMGSRDWCKHPHSKSL